MIRYAFLAQLDPPAPFVNVVLLWDSGVQVSGGHQPTCTHRERAATTSGLFS
jgi:hypothetical protein